MLQRQEELQKPEGNHCPLYHTAAHCRFSSCNTGMSETFISRSWKSVIVLSDTLIIIAAACESQDTKPPDTTKTEFRKLAISQLFS